MCTLFTRIGASRRPFLASTSDDPYPVQNQVVGAGTQPYAYLAVRVVNNREEDLPWGNMLTRGINAAGLAYTYAFVWEPEVDYRPSQDWVPAMLATCTTVAEATEHMRQHADTLLSGNYLVADRTGVVSAIEVANATVAPRRARGRIVVCANRWEHHKMHAAGDWGAETAAARFDRACALLTKDGDGMESLVRVLRDHGDQGCDAGRNYGTAICNHGRQQGTISAELLDTGRAWLWWAHGWPCGHRRGYELSTRTPWGRFIAFAVDRLERSEEHT